MLQLLYFFMTLTCAPSTYLGIRIYSIPSGAMEPNLHVGSYVAVHRCAYGIGRYTFEAFELPMSGRVPDLLPARGDVIVFRQPRQPSVSYVKRVIGLPGDRLEMRDGRVYLNGAPADRRSLPPVATRNSAGRRVGAAAFRETLPGGGGYTIVQTGDTQSPSRNVLPVSVPSRHLYVLGDNRDDSLDSRHDMIGFVPLENVVGRVVGTGDWFLPAVFGPK